MEREGKKKYRLDNAITAKRSSMKKYFGGWIGYILGLVEGIRGCS